MAFWQVCKAGVPTGAFIDDGLEFEPGDEGFTIEAALALAEDLDGDSVNYVGKSQ